MGRFLLHLLFALISLIPIGCFIFVFYYFLFKVRFEAIELIQPILKFALVLFPLFIIFVGGIRLFSTEGAKLEVLSQTFIGAIWCLGIVLVNLYICSYLGNRHTEEEKKQTNEKINF